MFNKVFDVHVQHSITHQKQFTSTVCDSWHPECKTRIKPNRTLFTCRL